MGGEGARLPPLMHVPRTRQKPVRAPQGVTSFLWPRNILQIREQYNYGAYVQKVNEVLSYPI